MPTGYDPVTGQLLATKRRHASATFVRPANTDAYAAGDVVGPVTTPVLQTLSAVVPQNGGSGRIKRVVLLTNLATVTNGTFLIFFFNALWTPQADNAVETGIYTLGGASLQGYVSMPILITPAAASVAALSQIDDDFGGGDDGLPLDFECAAGNTALYALIIATAAYVPASSQPFRLSIITEPD